MAQFIDNGKIAFDHEFLTSVVNANFGALQRELGGDGPRDLFMLCDEAILDSASSDSLREACIEL
jgi:hypothetical protein